MIKKSKNNNVANIDSWIQKSLIKFLKKHTKNMHKVSVAIEKAIEKTK